MPRYMAGCKSFIYLFKFFFLISSKVMLAYGRKIMIVYLAQKYKVNISQKGVADALKTVALNYYARRQTDTACLITLVTNYIRIKTKNWKCTV